MITVLMIAVGLAMDAFAVSISCGLIIEKPRMVEVMRIGLFFGIFQMFMPIIGWFAGKSLRGLISGVDHWVAFGLLGLIGCKMIYESFKITGKKFDPLRLKVLLILSLATSIDALAVGLGFSLLKMAIVTPAVVIGLITFLFSILGVVLGKKFGALFERKIEIIGGLILILIGTKILIQHLA